MDENDDIIASFGHVVLAGLAGTALSTTSGASFTHPGMHANYLLHGLTGGLHFLSKTTGFSVQPLYIISKQAVQYLALPSLMADLYYEQKYVSIAHFASGLLPFIVAVTGNDNPHLSNFAISVNIISLCYYAIKNTCLEYAWYPAGCAIITYFGLNYVNALFPIGLAITEYFAHKLYNENFGPHLTPQERKEIDQKKKEVERKKKEVERKMIKAKKDAEKAAEKAFKAAAKKAQEIEKARLKQYKQKK